MAQVVECLPSKCEEAMSSVLIQKKKVCILCKLYLTDLKS
jgi:hypothetical protein